MHLGDSGADAPAISINRRAITLQGAGIDQTMISAPAGTTPAEVAIQVDEVTGADVRITGFTFSGATNSGVEMVRVNGTSKSFRLDHNKFSATGLAIGVDVAGATYGVLDHNNVRQRTGGHRRRRRRFVAEDPRPL